ncbi:MAG: c-type cytochrome [Limnohabitans sp.]
MKNTLSLLALLASLLLTPSSSWAQTSAALGRADYRDNCASCHGMSGQGDGPMRASLVKPPADLTTIAQRNGGQFPQELIWELIDGRWSGEGGPHGSREMPVWGQEFKKRAMTQRGDSARTAELSARDRIISLLKYLQDIQVK